MGELLLQLKNRQGDWTTAHRAKPGDPPGSLSNNTPDGGREIYIAECLADHARIYRSIGGADFLQEEGAKRNIMSVGKELLATLRAGEIYEIHVSPDRIRARLHARYRYTG
jgi:hypothetical protein